MMAEATDDAPNDVPSHVRDATRSASDVGCIMRILRILFALDGRGRDALPPSWGLRCTLCAALRRLAPQMQPRFAPRLRAGIHFRLRFLLSPSLSSRCNLLLRPAI